MTFDLFASVILFTFFFSYFIMVLFSNFMRLFPGSKSQGLRVDFRKYD